MQRSLHPQESHANFEMSLRDQLIAAQSSQPPPLQPTTHQTATTTQTYASSNSSSPHDEQQIDPSISASEERSYDITMSGNLDDALAAMANAANSGRRELSTSKRAAQNRAAQRAFRQRKEAYIDKLEKQVKDYRVMESDFKTLQQENYALREYILSLQGRLLETSSDLPPPPPQVTLQNPNSHSDSHHDQLRKEPTKHARTPKPNTMGSSIPNLTVPTTQSLPPTAVRQLQATAAQAGGFGEGEGSSG